MEFPLLIDPFVQDGSFDPNLIDAMSRALADACMTLRLEAKDNAATRLLAMRIIELARKGVHDIALLKVGAIQGFRPSGGH
jgi:hypothetical protein